jgi:tRNA 2-thiouridine synthesizing protein C
MDDSPEAYEGDDYEGGVVKKFMYVNRRAPHGTIYAQESLEVVLIGAAFDQDVSVVFVDDGVYQIHKDQDTSAIGTKNFSKTFRALEMYDVEKLYVEKESMELRGMTEDDFNVEVEVKTSEEIGRLMEEQDVILSF